MFTCFNEIVATAKSSGRQKVAVAAAHDWDVLEAVNNAHAQGLIDPILIGDRQRLEPLLKEVGLPPDIPVIHETDDTQAALTAVALVHSGEAAVLMKGLVNSSIFLKAVLHQDKGLRTGRLLSHLAAFEIPGTQKLVYHTDGGMNVAPGLKEKKDILVNALEALKTLGIPKPKVAILAANEMANPKIPATTDAQALVAMNENGELTAGIIEGPIAMDVAVSAEAARHKGLKSKISGETDLFIVPTIEAGNLVGKTLTYYAKAKIAGIIIGASHPIVMTSRADTPEAKLNSIALACVAAAR